MLGAIVGDIIGSCHEFSGQPVEEKTFPLFTEASRFTDDSVLTLAVAQAVMQGYGDEAATGAATVASMRTLGRMFPNAGYGGGFFHWLMDERTGPYNSMGNGSAMRVSSVGWAYDTLPQVETYARITAAVTHSHPEGIRGAQAVAAAIWMARTGASKDDVAREIVDRYGYNLSQNLAEIRRRYAMHRSIACQDTVPEALCAFLASDTFEDAVRKAVALGGDTDTLACIAGSVAEAFYGAVPAPIAAEAIARLDPRLGLVLKTWQNWLDARTDPNPDA